MKRNVLQSIIQFVFRYIWLFCAVLIVLELTTTMYTAQMLLVQSADGVLQSVAGEVSGRVDGVLRLLQGLAQDERMADTSIPLYDRAVLARPYRDSYNLYMIAFCDEDVNVVSTNEPNPPAEMVSLAYRDYMQRLYSTGLYQITDAFPAGSDGVTMNYTIAVPIIKDEKTAGCVFGSIYFDDIEETLNRYTDGTEHRFYLLGRDNKFMAGGSKKLYGKPLIEAGEQTYYMGTSLEQVNQDLLDGKSGGCWTLGSNGLCYIRYERVAQTEWTIAYQVRFRSVFTAVFPTLFGKCIFYLLICCAISLLGRRYLKRHLAAVNHLLDRVSVMQKEIFQSEQPDYDNLLELTQKGLTDELTGLSTRAVLFEKMVKLLSEKACFGAVLFIDLDNLKQLNDTYGHAAGDSALLHFAKVLQSFEQQAGGLAARYGGDEFVYILDGVDSRSAAELAEQLQKALSAELSVDGKAFTVHGSAGVAFYPQHGSKPEELISKADFALYTAKQDGKNRCAFYDENSEPIST